MPCVILLLFWRTCHLPCRLLLPFELHQRYCAPKAPSPLLALQTARSVLRSPSPLQKLALLLASNVLVATTVLLAPSLGLVSTAAEATTAPMALVLWCSNTLPLPSASVWRMGCSASPRPCIPRGNCPLPQSLLLELHVRRQHAE